MKKIWCVIKNIIGIILIILGVILTIVNTENNYVFGFYIILSGILLTKVFDYMTILFNRYFSVGRKIALFIGSTFIVSTYYDKSYTGSDIFYIYLVIIIFYVLMFVFDKKKYIDIDKKIMLPYGNNKLLNKVIDARNKRVLDIINEEEKVKELFKGYNIITINTICKLLASNKKYEVLGYDINLGDMFFYFSKELKYINIEEDFTYLTNSFYKKVINKYCRKLYLDVLKLMRMDVGKNCINLYNDSMNVLFNTMDTLVDLKFIDALGKSNNSDMYDKVGLRHFDDSYKKEITYLIDILVTFVCIIKIMFLESKIKLLDKDNEFYKIVKNISKEINDIDVIVDKVKPIYNEFYRNELGNINNEVLFMLTLLIIDNNDLVFSEKDDKILNITDTLWVNYEDIIYNMNDWIKYIAYNYRSIDPGLYVTIKINKNVSMDDFNVYLKVLSNYQNYIDEYYRLVDLNNKTSDKERYLKGNFEKEKEELKIKYSLDNVVTGEDFELFLMDVFKHLGYDVKHLGKSGDQGADLILKKNDISYAVQAKFYKNKLGNTPVQEIIGALKYYDVKNGVVVTNSMFTKGAYELAKVNNVILVDGKGLKKLITYISSDNHDEDYLKLVR